MLTHAELVQRGANWFRNNQRYPIVLTEYACDTSEIPDVIGFSTRNTGLIECKISLTDFRSDKKKKHRIDRHSMGNFRYYLCPNKLIPLIEVPDDWGLLYCHPHKITIVRKAPYHDDTSVRQYEYPILYSIARRAQLRGYMPEIIKPITQEVTI